MLLAGLKPAARSQLIAIHHQVAALAPQPKDEIIYTVDYRRCFAESHADHVHLINGCLVSLIP
jgi:hypothetical protein